MSKITTFLNYIAFLILYITSFIIIYVKNTEIIGFYFLFVVNAAFTLYNLFYFLGLGNAGMIPTAIGLSIFISGVFHTVCFIFIIMMVSDMRIKFKNTYGTPIKLPPMYGDKLEEFKRLTITTFSICALLFIILMSKYEYYNSVSFFNISGTFIDIIRVYFTEISILLLSLAPIIISSIQVASANEFAVLSRRHFIK
jgi:hypothetical protein